MAETGIGALTDTTLNSILSTLLGQDFDFLDAVTRNIYANALSAFIRDPVEAATAMYFIHTTDFILASILNVLKLERTYCSTSKKTSCLGKGWSFTYGSHIYRDSKDRQRISKEPVSIQRKSWNIIVVYYNP